MEKFGEASVGDQFSPESDEPMRETIKQTVRPEECEGHFESGPRILPAFRMLGKLTDKLANRGVTPRTVQMLINDILPEGAPYFANYDLADPTQQQLILTRQKEVIITSSAAPLILLYQPEIFSQERPPQFPADQILFDRQAIGKIIPQGANLQLIDAVLCPNPNYPDVLAEALHRTTSDDYESIGISDYSYFDKSRMLEGLGQLAYVYFDQQLHPAVPTIPFFKEVTIDFNPDHQPLLGDTIYYQLTHFKTDFGERGDKGTGTIAGRVMVNNYQHLIANFTATVGALEQTKLERLAKIALAQSRKKADQSSI